MHFPPITLGTVQLGMPYGIAGSGGMPSTAEAYAILDAAWAGGVTCLDTARAYGASEARIGGWCATRGQRPTIVTKIPPVPPGSDPASAVHKSIEESCAALAQDRLAGVLVHRATDLDTVGVAKTLRNCVADGKIGAFGASVYDVSEARRALEINGVGLMQLPASILDWRMADSGVVAEAASRGVAVFARSVYCQGLLFLDPATLPPHVAGAALALQRLRAIAEETGTDLAALALGGVRGVTGLASVVIGADSVGQVDAAVSALAAPLPAPEILVAIRRAASTIPAAVVDPRCWPRR